MRDSANKKITMYAMLTAVTAILAQITIPMPSAVPITLQSFAAALCGYMAGSKGGAVSMLVYIAAGVVGMPVFSGFTGGFSVIFGLGGGFIIGFVPLAVFCGGFIVSPQKGRIQHAIAIGKGLIGLALCHICGILQFSIITGTEPQTAFFVCSAPYIIKDIISVAGAYFISLNIKKKLSSAT